ncbi:RidA family protein [Nitratireductor aquimarinus]|uniref:RidA family protein n=1 Tax=Nitratireductor TaxID=245876 RepID=UPI001A8EF374|nr:MULTISPECIES: RidA family protein [Nitratireductor]MBN8244759.1 RidA family protein [Nitratireductor aquimarinus]MBY6133146.1 RidA family protein [Nitratireductor aquimarinus]MCA1303452.1 RidA family protein [Nitratireductor aquimarinus]MCV0381634.1 RidA family protein [Nitratireductor sp.]MDJ1464180.1 RidA family protein [Nitratireductor sp. GZWM139]
MSDLEKTPKPDEPRLLHEAVCPQGWPQPKGYANAVMTDGGIIYTGGLVGWDREGRFPEGFVAQAHQTFRNIRDVLEAAGAGPEHLTRLTWYVTSVEDYLADPKGLGRAYRDVFGRCFPAMATVEVTRLVEPEAVVEIEATAVLPRG